MYKLKLFVLFFQVIFWTFQIQAQENTYRITKGDGTELGTVSASIKKSGNLHTYTILSEVTFKVLWKTYNRKTSNIVAYRNGSMRESYSCVYMNEKLQDSSSVRLVDNGYHCFRSPDLVFQLNEKGLHFSSSRLYFKEPVGVNRVYSERYLEYCSLEPLGNHRYKLTLPNGKSNYYTYRNNKLTEIAVERDWFDLKIRSY